MTLQDSAKLVLLIDGSLQVTTMNIQVKGTSGSQPIMTIQGLFGFSSAGGFTGLTGTAAIPIGGLEFDFISASAKKTYHTVQIPFGGQSLRFSGKFGEYTAEQPSEGASSISFDFTGELVALE